MPAEVAVCGDTELLRLDAEGQPAGASLSFRGALRLQPLDAASTFGVFDVAHGAGYFWAGREHRYYRGVAELRPQAAKGVTLVNELGMEAYLLSVVPSEAWAQWPAESLKAQAASIAVHNKLPMPKQNPNGRRGIFLVKLLAGRNDSIALGNC